MKERKPVTEQRSRTIGLNSLGFVLVALAGYLSALVTLGYVLKTISLTKATTLIAVALSYLIIGVYGYALARNSATFKSALVYFAIQIILATTLIFLAKSPSRACAKERYRLAMAQRERLKFMKQLQTSRC